MSIPRRELSLWQQCSRSMFKQAPSVTDSGGAQQVCFWGFKDQIFLDSHTPLWSKVAHHSFKSNPCVKSLPPKSNQHCQMSPMMQRTKQWLLFLLHNNNSKVMITKNNFTQMGSLMPALVRGQRKVSTDSQSPFPPIHWDGISNIMRSYSLLMQISIKCLPSRCWVYTTTEPQVLILRSSQSSILKFSISPSLPLPRPPKSPCNAAS